MEVTRSTEVVLEMDRIIHDLIILCKQIDIHIVMIMHPKKTDHGRVESEFDIKGSSTAVQEAHNVFLLNRPTFQQIQNENRCAFDRDLKIAKMRRNGLYVGKSVVFNSQGTRYLDSGMK